MRSFLAALLLAAFTGSAGAALQDEATDTVRLMVMKGANSTGVCSVTVIAPGMGLTAGHCVEASIATKAPMRVKQGSQFLPVGAAFPLESDVAVLVVPGLACPCAVLGGDAVKGDKVVAIGFPSGHTIPPQEGFALDIGAAKDRYAGMMDPADPSFSRVFQYHSAMVSEGMSGGGLFAQRDGKWVLVGINVFTVRLPFIGFVEAGAVPVSVFAPAIP